MLGPIEQTQLPNGMRIVALPVPTAQVVSVVVGVDIGAADEAVNQYGAAHFVEHMLFKGTASRGLGEIDEEIEAMGGAINAYTSHDETVYYATVRAERWVEALAVLSDMLQNSRFDEADLQIERQVILEELRGTQEVPSEQLGQALMKALWPTHPYGRPVGAQPEEVEALKAEDIVAFWSRWYRPANMTLCVAGPIQAEDVIHQATQCFVGTAAAVARTRPNGSVASLEQAIYMKRDFHESCVELAFSAPSLGDEQGPVLLVLATLLGGSEASPLVERMQYQMGVANGAWASFSPRRDGGAFFVGCQPVKGKDSQAYQALWEVLRSVLETGFSDEELARAKALLRGDRELSSQTVESKALDALWHLQRMGDPDYGRRYLAQVEAVSVSQVLEAARAMFQMSQATKAFLVPLDGPNQTEFVAPADRPVRVGPSHTNSKTLSRRLSGGTTVLVEPGLAGGMSAIRVLGLGGRLLESPSRAGRSRIWASAVVCGAGPLNNRELSERLSLRGAGLAAAAFGPTMKLGIDCRREVLDEAIEWLSSLLFSPHFEESELHRLGREASEALDGLMDRPAAMAWEKLNRTIFSGHPYGLSKIGHRRSLSGITSRQMWRLHRSWAQAGNLVVSVVGTGEAERIADRLERVLAPLQDNPGAGPEVPEPCFPAEEAEHIVRAGRGQSQVILGWGTKGLNQPDRLALDLAAAVMGSPAGRLFQRLRDHHALAYDLDASHASALQGGCFALELSTEAARSEEARDRLQEELRKVANHGVAGDELARAKAQLVFSRLDALQLPGSRAAELAYWERCSGNGSERVEQELAALEAVRETDVQEAVHRLLEDSSCVIVRSLPRKRTD